MTAMAEVTDHETLVEMMTGGMVNFKAEQFAGSDRLRTDGRPKPELRSDLRKIDNLRNSLTVVGALVAPVLVIAAVVRLGAPLWAILVSIPVIGTLQNRLYVLHHEAAHRLLFSNRRANDLIGVNLIGVIPFGTGTHHYRRGHAAHHRDEFGPDEPDFLLYSFYPVSRDSFRRKLTRDVSGVSAYRITKPRFTGLFNKAYRGISYRFFGAQLLILGVFFLIGHPWLYLFTWLIPYATYYQFINRLRAIAEHGGMTRSFDRRLTTHHVRQTAWSRALLAPIGVGYHLAHHVDSGIPFRNLARFHQILVEDGYVTSGLTWSNYRELWLALASRQAAQPTSDAGTN